MRRIKKQLAVLLTLALLFPLAISAASAEEPLTLSEYEVIEVKTAEELAEVLGEVMLEGKSNVEIRLSGIYDMKRSWFWNGGIYWVDNIRLIGTDGTMIRSDDPFAFRILESSNIEICNIAFNVHINIEESQNVTLRDCKIIDCKSPISISVGSGSTVSIQNMVLEDSYGLGANTNSIMTFENCTFKNNGYDHDDGRDVGGFEIYEDPDELGSKPVTNFINCTFENNAISHFKQETYIDPDTWEEQEQFVKTGYNDGYTTERGCIFINNGWQEGTVFTDVHKGDWFYDSVMYVYKEKLFSGVTETQFSPNAPMTRAMIATVIYRSADAAQSPVNHGFTDVPSNIWYTDAVNWAAHAGIVSGIGDNKFDPDGNVTREQMAEMLYNYAELLGRNLPVERVSYAFADNDKISPWAAEAVDAMYRAELLNGYETGNFNPQGNASRAEVATVLMKFLEAMFF